MRKFRKAARPLAWVAAIVGFVLMLLGQDLAAIVAFVISCWLFGFVLGAMSADDWR